MGPWNPEPPLRYPVKEAARLLGLGRTTLYELFKSGQLRSIKDWGRRLVPRDALLEYDARRKAAAGWDTPNAVGGPGERVDSPRPAEGARAAIAVCRVMHHVDSEGRVVGKSGALLADRLGEHVGGRGAAAGEGELIMIDNFAEFRRSRQWVAEFLRSRQRKARVVVTMPRPRRRRAA